MRPLEDWLRQIEQYHPAEIELGLDRILTVYRRLTLNFDQTCIVTVAGTNGKGSTIAALEALFLDAGFRVAVYTSPHILRFAERIRTGGCPVDDETLISAFEQVDQAREGIDLTFFEFTTLAALLCFHLFRPDYMLLEVGLGGRLDAVNIVDPQLAVITGVDFDHTDWLGDDLEQIGYEKAGIIRPGIPVVLGQEVMPDSVTRAAEVYGSATYQFGNQFGIAADSCAPYICRAGEETCYLDDVTSVLPFQNMMTALQVFGLLLPDRDMNNAVNVINNVSLAGRMEVVSHYPKVILDVGHNPQAARFLSNALRPVKADSGGKLGAVYSSLKDKDYRSVVDELASVVDVWYLTPLDVPRACDLQELCDAVAAMGAQYKVFDSVEEAVSEAMFDHSGCGAVIVFGSFYVVESAKRYFATSG